MRLKRPSPSSHYSRLNGYRDGLAASGIQPNAALVTKGDRSRAGSKSHLPLLNLPYPLTAIIGVNDFTEIGAMRAVRDSEYFG